MTSPVLLFPFKSSDAMFQLTYPLAHAEVRRSSPKPPTAIRPVCHRPNPEKRPQRTERKNADHRGDADCILVRMVPSLSNVVRDAPNGDQSKYDKPDDHDEDGKRDPIKH